MNEGKDLSKDANPNIYPDSKNTFQQAEYLLLLAKEGKLTEEELRTKLQLFHDVGVQDGWFNAFDALRKNGILKDEQLEEIQAKLKVRFVKSETSEGGEFAAGSN